MSLSSSRSSTSSATFRRHAVEVCAQQQIVAVLAQDASEPTLPMPSLAGESRRHHRSRPRCGPGRRASTVRASRRAAAGLSVRSGTGGLLRMWSLASPRSPEKHRSRRVELAKPPAENVGLRLVIDRFCRTEPKIMAAATQLQAPATISDGGAWHDRRGRRGARWHHSIQRAQSPPFEARSSPCSAAAAAAWRSAGRRVNASSAQTEEIFALATNRGDAATVALRQPAVPHRHP